MNKIQRNMKPNFRYGTFLLLLFINFFLLFPKIVAAKGGGGGGGGSSGGGGIGGIGGGGYSSGSSSVEEPFFKYANGRRICTITCICISTFTVLSAAAVIILLCFSYTRNKKYKKNHTKKHRNTTDDGESGINNNVNNVNNVNRSDNDGSLLPPSYESTNPAPDPPYELGKKNDATIISLNDAREFSKQHPPNENLPTSEEIENIITQDGYKAWKFVPEDIIIKSQRAFISNDGRKIEFYKRKRGFKYDDIMIQTNYPFFSPDFHAVNSEEIELDIMHYFEITLLSKSKDAVAIGITTKPYPYFRLPGWNINSVGYHSDDGRKFLSDEFGGRDYGPEWGESGDVIGCGYKPKTGEIFFTKNGNFLGNAFAGLRHTWYPTIGSDGNVKMKINFGDELFVYKYACGFGVGAPKNFSSKK